MFIIKFGWLVHKFCNDPNVWINFIICRYEEYIDYLFPEESQASNLKILEQPYKWKKQKRDEDEDTLASDDDID